MQPHKSAELIFMQLMQQLRNWEYYIVIVLLLFFLKNIEYLNFCS